MLANVDDQLHALTRVVAAQLVDPDKKQLRFNDIVENAKRFYPDDAEAGVVELTRACDRAETDLYIPKQPMWKVLWDQYWWMLDPLILKPEWRIDK